MGDHEIGDTVWFRYHIESTRFNPHDAAFMYSAVAGTVVAAYAVRITSPGDVDYGNMLYYYDVKFTNIKGEERTFTLWNQEII